MLSFISQRGSVASSSKPSFFPIPDNSEEENTEPERDSFIPTGALRQPPKADSAAPVTSTKPDLPAPSLDSLTPAQSAALAALPAAPAAALQYVWKVNEGNADLLRKTLTLLEKGSLADVYGGKTTIEQLKELGDTPRVSGLSSAWVTERTVSILADPEAGINQGVNSSCGAAVLEYQMANRPALFVEAVDQLTDSEGVFQGPQGTRLERLPNFHTDDKSQRELLDKIVQDAIMQAAGGPKHGEYDPLADKFSDGSRGLQALEIAKQAANIEGKEQAVVLHDGGTSAVFKELFHALPNDRPTHVGAYWNQQDHMLVYRGQKDGEASFFNPQTSGKETIDVNTFLFKTQFAIFPADLVKPRASELPEDAVYYVQPDQASTTEAA